MNTNRRIAGRLPQRELLLGGCCAAISARAASAAVGSNSRINVGIIGAGGMGTAHLRALVAQSEQAEDVQVVGGQRR